MGRTTRLLHAALVAAALLSGTTAVATAEPTSDRGTPPDHAPAIGLRSLDEIARLPSALDFRGRRPGVADVARARRSSRVADAVSLVVGLPEVWAPTAGLNGEERGRQVARIRAAERALLDDLGDVVLSHRSFDGFVPHVAVTVAPEDVERVAASPAAARIDENPSMSPALEQSTQIVGSTDARQLGFDGSGQAVAILDSGVDRNHPFLAGRVVAEACFSAGANCPNGATSQTGTGAGAACTYSDSCPHGTHVAGIAAGAGRSWSGVAPASDIVAVQVFHKVEGNPCIESRRTSPCIRTSSDAQIAALRWVAGIADDVGLAAVNLSVGGDVEYVSACDSLSTGYAAAIAELVANGVAVVISSGNDGFNVGVSFPGCMSQAITTGNTTKNDTLAASSNHGNLVDVMAPGSGIYSSIPGGSYAAMNGTSMAAPHVAGAIALMRQRDAGASVADMLSALVSTGVPVSAQRSATTRNRIQVDAALLALSGARQDDPEPPPSGLCPTNDWRDVGDEQSWPLINGRSEYGVICSGDVDWFVFPGGEGSSIDIQLSFDHASGDLDLELWDLNEMLLKSDSATDDERITGTVNTPNTYYVKVFGYNGAENDYELSITYTSCPPDDVFEPNDDVGTATNLTGGGSLWGEACGGDLDVYRIDLTAGQSVGAWLSFIHRLGDVDMTLYDPALETVSLSIGTSDDEYVNYTAARTGSHYLVVEGYAGAENSYGLVVRVGDLCPGNDPYEPNDDQITPMRRDQVLSGVACSSENDWFGVELEPGVALDIDLYFTHANGDLDLEVYDPAGDLFAASDSISDNESATVTADTVGTWYLRVTGYQGDSNTYQLVTDSRIVNDDLADATLLTGTEGVIAGTTDGATRESAEPRHADVPTSGTVWFEWVAPAAGYAVFHTHDSDIDTVLGVYDLDGSGALSEVVSNDDVSGLLTSHSGHFPVEAGDRFFVAVGAYDTAEYDPDGPFRLHWRIDDAAAANADPDRREGSVPEDPASPADPGDVAWTDPRPRDIVATCDDQQGEGFPDVSDSNVHEYTIRCIAGHGITVGRADGSYNPSGTLTVGQTATFLVRTLEAGGAAPPAAGGACGTDQRTHTESIERLIAAEVVTTAACAAHSTVIQRGEMAQMVHDALTEWAAMPTPDGTIDRDYYTDDDGHTNEQTIDTITALGIVTGRGDGTFRPDTNLSRAQMATFLARCIDALLDRQR